MCVFSLMPGLGIQDYPCQGGEKDHFNMRKCKNSKTFPENMQLTTFCIQMPKFS